MTPRARRVASASGLTTLLDEVRDPNPGTLFDSTDVHVTVPLIEVLVKRSNLSGVQFETRDRDRCRILKGSKDRRTDAATLIVGSDSKSLDPRHASHVVSQCVVHTKSAGTYDARAVYCFQDRHFVENGTKLGKSLREWRDLPGAKFKRLVEEGGALQGVELSGVGFDGFDNADGHSGILTAGLLEVRTDREVIHR